MTKPASLRDSGFQCHVRENSDKSVADSAFELIMPIILLEQLCSEVIDRVSRSSFDSVLSPHSVTHHSVGSWSANSNASFPMRRGWSKTSGISSIWNRR